MTLRALREKPFELLRELERRSKGAVSGDAAASVDEWVGVAFRMGPEHFIAARAQVREVLPVPAQLTRVPGAASWLRGIANVRGHLLPVSDLRALLGGGGAVRERRARVLVINHREVPAGLIVDEVYGFRRFLAEEYRPDAPPTILRAEPFLDGAYRRGDESWPVFDLQGLVESERFQRAVEA